MFLFFFLHPAFVSLAVQWGGVPFCELGLTGEWVRVCCRGWDGPVVRSFPVVVVSAMGGVGTSASSRKGSFSAVFCSFFCMGSIMDVDLVMSL